MSNNLFTSSNRKLLGLVKKIRRATDFLYWAYKVNRISAMFCEIFTDLS